MAAWDTLKNYIDLHILNKLPAKISADTDHNPTLQLIVDTFGEDYIYSGIAITTTVPINDDKKRMYIAYGTVGTYVNFLNDSAAALTLNAGEFAVFRGVENIWVKQPFFPNSTFLTPDDTPSTYASKAEYGVFVNAAETALEFVPVKKYTFSKDDEVTDHTSKLTDVATGGKALPYSGATEGVNLGSQEIRTTGAAQFGTLNVETIAAETTDVDKFLVSNAGDVKYRTGAEVLSDINAGSVTEVTSADTNKITVATGTTTPAITAVTGAVAEGATGLVTGNDVYDYIMSISLAHGSMYFNENSTAQTPIVNKEIGITNRVEGDGNGFSFIAGEEGTFSATADYGTYVTITVGAHHASVGDYVVISQSSSNGIHDITGNYAVTAISATTINILYGDWNASETGVWQLPSQLKLTKTDIMDVDFEVRWDLCCSAAGTSHGDIVDWTCWNSYLELIPTKTRRTLSTLSDWGAFGGGGTFRLTTGDVIYMTLKSDDNNDITHRYGSLSVSQSDHYSHVTP